MSNDAMLTLTFLIVTCFVSFFFVLAADRATKGD